MTTQTPPDGEAILRQMVDGLEGVTPGPWNSCSPSTIHAIAAHVATLTAERNAALRHLETSNNIQAELFKTLFELDKEYDAALARVEELAACLRDIEGRSREVPTGNPKWINEHARTALKEQS